ncbi:MAG: glucosidase, partial [Rubrivivax sp.]|nr:glucosidase [Pyrinomonadaceae bacterium]
MTHAANSENEETFVTGEEKRLRESSARTAHWKRWGPYIAERAWGTVREDYSADGDAWNYLPHDAARSRAYRWNEDGIAGICDRHQQICFALALWNGRDPFLKERMFGCVGSEANHGEDVKEYYFYLDSTPTHSYMKYLYKYPQGEFPYAQLIEENRRRGKRDAEFELLETGIFDEDRYFDVLIEYAKEDAEEILVRITAFNRGPEAAELHLLPTIWFRNTWSWDADAPRPELRRVLAGRVAPVGAESGGPSIAAIEAQHDYYGTRWLYCEGEPELLFTENDTNTQLLYGTPNGGHVIDGINDYVVSGAHDAVNHDGRGTKAAAHYALTIPPGESAILRMRFTDKSAGAGTEGFGEAFDRTFDLRIREADEFYSTVIPEELSEDARRVMRQSLAGLLWSKQFYLYVVKD